ncbi:MAG: hydroxysqualene dehydroxylase HpnE [Novosphingobium sp.]
MTAVRRATIAGAGLAGLAAAVALREAGVAVALSDSAAQAGGRCRSYHDPALGMTIDNGNHLVLAGNQAVADFRRAVGATAPLAGPDHADFAFADVTTGERWTVGINDGRLPWWVLSTSRRVPGTHAREYLALGRLLRAGSVPIGQVVEPSGPLWDRFIDPVMLAVLNTPVAASSAALAARVLGETMGKGGLATRPRIAQPTLGAAFIEPALGWLGERGTTLATGRRLKALEFAGERVSTLVWNDGPQAITADEAVILAVPAWVALDLVPGLTAPTAHHAILNGHFAVAPPPGTPAMLGVIGGTAEWIFAHDNRLSVTVSHADRLADNDREALARTLWADICRALDIATPLPAWQIVKEKRATFAATPEQDALRPGTRTPWGNLFLAGDWVQNGLPATIEGALRTGDGAARLALGRSLRYGLPRC